MNIAVVIGTRPQFIKLAPFIKEAKTRFNLDVIDTGQHYDDAMSGQFFRELAIPKPRYSLKVGSGGHAQQTGQMLIKLERILNHKDHDMVVVFGDTNSTLAGALTAAKLQIPIAHVEAGARSFDRTMPEEINRVVTDVLADICFASTERCVRNLLNEGKRLDQIFMVGDIMIDSLECDQKDRAAGSPLKEYHYSLLTLHRPSNVDSKERLERIFDVLRVANVPMVFPVHPRTRDRMKQFSIDPPPNVKLIQPVNHFQMLHMIRHADKVVTDSGGVQKEAYLLSKPCITVRNTTEWMETVDAGWNVLVDGDPVKFLESILNFTPPKEHPPVLGGPGASSRICAVLDSWASNHLEAKR